MKTNKRLIVTALTILIICLGFSLAQAVEKTISAGWDWPGVETDITGFSIKDQQNAVLTTVPATAREATFVTNVAEGGCIALFVVAVALDGEESPNSNIINYCLPKPKLIKVNSFSFTIE